MSAQNPMILYIVTSTSFKSLQILNDKSVQYFRCLFVILLDPFMKCKFSCTENHLFAFLLGFFFKNF